MVRFFGIAWWVGFIVSVGLMVSFYLGFGVFSNDFLSNIEVGHLFLIFGIVHMTILVILGFYSIVKTKADNIEIASRVSTMGYLHTLIGTAVALIMTSKFGADIITHINEIIAPIGSALVTSIIGWAFAKEMELESYSDKIVNKEDVERELEVLAKVIRSVGTKLEISADKWENKMSYTVDKLQKTTDNVDDNIKRSYKKSEELISTLYGEIKKNIEDMTSSFHEDLMKSSKGTDELIENLVNGISGGFDNLQKEMKANIHNITTHFKEELDISSESSKEVINGYIGNFENLHKDMKANLDSVTNHFKKNLENSSESSEQFMSGLLDRFDNLYKEMDTNLSNITQHFKEDLDKSSESSKEVISGLIKSFDNLHREMKSNLTKVTTHFREDLEKSSKSSQEVMAKFMNSFESIFKEIETNVKVVEHSLKDSSINSEKVLNNLNSSFEKLFHQINGISIRWDRHLKSMEVFSHGTDKSLRELFDSSIKIAEEMHNVAGAVPKANTIIKEIDNLLSIINNNRGGKTL